MIRRNRRHGNTDAARVPAKVGEPALIRGGVMAALSLLSWLGFRQVDDLTRGQVTAIVGVAAVAYPLLQAVWTRAGVVARDLIVAYIARRDGAVVAGEAAATATGAELNVRPAEKTDTGATIPPSVSVPVKPPATR